ncbi:universal stress protein [Thermococcus thioreducens]|uniref:Universal stress protein n=1 Tax=Thermococcus thioreducens TaxID=277988 RepID=A0A0Q2MU75_9EURY|nr:universal stress protein [Thermococcus thioreducens]ASJ13275.1 universal stress protein [Thermococcus thioreducens]KQH83311.1 universal stress protein [Thermococcus thioreducens]SEW21917.1 Nucleotide-binding universal stress protein, UspA family [Thermococcus thioreducens]
MRILVLVDGSKWSQKAALHAIAIAKRRGGKLTLFSVLDRREAKALAFNMGMLSQDLKNVQKFEEEIWREMKTSIKDIMTNLLELCHQEGVNCSIRIVEGSAKDTILGEANSGKYGLVVMGAYGRSGKTRIGSLLEEVVGSIEPPVLVVR